jgi:hypothetical protein
MKIELTEKEILAIYIGLDEMENSGMWENCIPEEDVKEVHNAIETLREKLP